MAEVAVRVLGGVRLQGPQGATSVGGRNAERLLGALVAAGGRGISIDELAEAVWPTDAPTSSVAPLRMAVSRLRRRLAEAGVPDAVSAEPGGYRLAVPNEQVDVERFRLLVADARALAASEPDRAAAHFDAALAVWRGEPFGRLASEPWAIIPVATWNDLHLDVEEEAAELELARHRQATVISRLQLAVERQPLRERRWAQLAIALFRLGRQAEALRAVGRARELLREELGADLGEDLRRVELGLLTHDPTLLTVGEQQNHPAPLARLIGRSAVVAEMLELLETNRVVTLHGLGGVGKSAVARHLARRQQDRGHNVVTARLDGLAGSDEVCLAVAAALGLPGAATPADLAAAAAGRGVGAATTLVLDGAEAAAPAVAELADALAATAPGLTVLVTSRLPIGADGEVPVLLEPLGVDTADGQAPAVQLFIARSGLSADRLSAEELDTVTRICERAAGLPLALELAAADVNAGDLTPLYDRTDGPEVDALGSAVAWALDALPESSRTLLEVASLLPDGLALDTFAPLGGSTSGQARQVMSPLLQSRLLATSGLGAGVVRYRPLEPVREIVEAGLHDDVRRARTDVAVGRLRAIARAVGGLEGMTNHHAMAAAEAELGNVRHWVARTVGSEEGLDLAVSMAVPMAEFGLGAEGAAWLDENLEALTAPDPFMWAKAMLARVVVRGFFSGTTDTPHDLEVAADISREREERQVWLALRARVALAKLWGGDLAGGAAMLEDSETLAVVRSTRDPWVDAQLERIRAMFLAARGQFGASLDLLQMVTSRFHELDDASSVLSSLYLRAYFARISGDDERSAAELLLAREMCFTGAARATQALVSAELAQHERRMGEERALVTMSEAIDALERAGNLRAAAVARRDIGSWRLADGDPTGVDDLGAALPTLLRTDRLAAGPALAEIAAVVAADQAERAGLLAGAARHLMRTAPGTSPASLERSRLWSLVQQLTAEQPAAAGAGAALDDEALVALAAGRASSV